METDLSLAKPPGEVTASQHPDFSLRRPQVEDPGETRQTLKKQKLWTDKWVLLYATKLRVVCYTIDTEYTAPSILCSNNAYLLAVPEHRLLF